MQLRECEDETEQGQCADQEKQDFAQAPAVGKIAFLLVEELQGGEGDVGFAAPEEQVKQDG